MALGFYRGLRAAFPAARIVLVCPEAFSDLTDFSLFDEVRPLSAKQRSGLSALRYWAQNLGGFEMAVLLTASWSSILQLAATGIPLRIGYAEFGAGFLLSRSLRWRGRSAREHKSRLYAQLLNCIPGAEWKPTFQPSPSVRRNAGPMVFAPGASISLREWPGFIDLAREVRRKYPQKIIRFVGTAAQAEWGARVDALGDPGVENWVGKTSLQVLKQMCCDAELVVANDSGVAHLAATLAGAPTVVLFGPGDPAYVVPEGPVVRVVRAEGVACSPCERARCRAPYGYQQCLKSLSVADVWNQVSSFLA